MGKIYQRVVASAITNAKQIACVVPTDHLLVCSVSNWGGYALAAAAATVSLAQASSGGIAAVNSFNSCMCLFLCQLLSPLHLFCCTCCIGKSMQCMFPVLPLVSLQWHIKPSN